MNIRLENKLTLGQILAGKDKTILFAGVGNVLKKDDGAGVYIATGIRDNGRISGLPVEMGIENHIGKINSLAPDILVIADAADFGRQPGFWRLAGVDEMTGLTTGTHNISFAKLSELFLMPVYVLGVQPFDVTFGEEMSGPVIKAVKNITELINSFSGSRSATNPSQNMARSINF